MPPDLPQPDSGEATSAAMGSPVQPLRPAWIDFSALALAVVLAIGLVCGLLQLWSGAPAAKLWGTRLLMSVLLLAASGIAGVCLWQFWKGQNWARLVVLLWASVAVANALAYLADHNADAAALMARPLLFFQTVLAVFLLYWLNTTAVRGWCKRLSGGPAALIAERLVGKVCTAVELHSEPFSSLAGWRIGFEHGAELVLHCPWRIVLDDNLAFAYSPSEDREALPAIWSALEQASMQDPAPNPAADSPQEARRLLKNLRVTALRIPPHTSDLLLSFEMGIELQTWNTRAKTNRPQWQYRDLGFRVIADEKGIRPQTAPAAPAAADEAAQQ